MPKGGGAIKGISEKFQTNPVTGTASFDLPLPVSPARDFEPQLALTYDSGSGNGPFGLGWTLNLPSISRKTEKGLPQYLDRQDLDTYTITGAEDMVPLLKQQNQNWQEITNPINLLGKTWEVKLYRPRIEGSFLKIERWRDKSTGVIWWRTVSNENVTTVYGLNDNACVFEPGNRARTFKWLPEFSYDDRGHVTRYAYKSEDNTGVEFSNASESHRRHVQFSQRYLKKVLYGLKESRFRQNLNDEALYSHQLEDRDFLFQTVFDYGDHSDDTPEPGADAWPVRLDPISSYKSGFEIRTYRRCHRVLLFHDFEELGNVPELVRSMNFTYDENKNLSLLTSITSTGYKRDENNVLQSKSFPPQEFEYQQHQWNQQLKAIDSDSLDNLPEGVDSKRYQWIDLYGEGISGVLTEQSGGLYYKQNLGNAALAEARLVSPSPSLKGFADNWQFQDLQSNGIKALVSTNGVVKGYYEIDDLGKWQDFIEFENMPNVRFDDPNLRILDLNGNGLPDLLITDEQIFKWYPSDGKKGFTESKSALAPVDEAGNPEIIFSNESESIFTADMSGDGLSDIVRIRNGSVVYWPNLGYGKFGPKSTMANSPYFNHSNLFTAGHIRLADIDGSGTTDIIYLGKNEFKFWLNNSGNSFSQPYKVLNPFPDISNLNNISVIDLLGSGTSCVVWSSPLPADRGKSIQYIDLMAGQKPHLLKTYQNGFGRTINLEYTASTQFYLEDKANGQPWVTKLHFPVHCMSKVETIDHITGSRFVSSYSYHHGYFDHAEREFRGFGRVDQFDTEQYDHFAKGAGSNVTDKVLYQPPVLVKTWFHNGAYLDQQRILDQYQHEYFQHKNFDKFQLKQPQLPHDLTAAEWREALRACKGMALRTETYGLDDTNNSDKPFSVTYNTCAIRKIQSKNKNEHSVFQVLETESVTMTVDRNPDDPRVSHNLLLDTDDYGQAKLSAVISYGRKHNGPQAVQEQQQRTHCLITQTAYTKDEFGLFGDHDFTQLDSVFRAPVAWKKQSFELDLLVDSDQGRHWSWQEKIFDAETVLDRFSQAIEIDYSINQMSGGEKRLLTCSETRFANDLLDGSRSLTTDPTDGNTLICRQHPKGIVWNSYQLAFTSTMPGQIYGGKFSSGLSQAGYVDLHDDGQWWAPSGHPVFHESSADQTEHRFYLPFGQQDRLGAYSWNELDKYLLLPVSKSLSKAGFASDNETADNKINKTIAINDYRTLSPKYLRDLNDNWTAVESDELGMVMASAVMGKVSGTDEQTPPDDETNTQGDNLANPSVMVEYEFYRQDVNPDGSIRHTPSSAKTRTFVEHFSASGIERDQLNSHLDFIDQYEYSNGAGNVVLIKTQAEPGVAKQVQPDDSVIEVDTRDFTPPTVRWIGNGRMIINNKGNPVKQYEPYFSVTPEYEDAADLVETGISPILFYDAAGRNICKLNPDKTYEKVVFNPWMQQSWDTNDNLYLMLADDSKQTDYRNDPDVGFIFTGLEESEFLPSWYQARINGDMGAEQQRTAQITEAHVATPAEVHTDALGRTIYSLTHDRDNNGNDQHFQTLSKIDIEDNLLSVTDDRDNVVMSYRYNMLPPPDEETPKPALYQNSMDGGEKWTLFDTQGKVIKNWDSRDHVFEKKYDELYRPTEIWVLENGERKLIGATDYYDSDHPDVENLKLDNLIGVAHQSYDQSGQSQTQTIDFKGNILRAQRKLVADYKTTIDWQANPNGQLEAEVFTSQSEFDALNRVIYAESPHTAQIPASITRPTYNESGSLDKMIVSIRDGPEQVYVQNIDYDAKGQRELIEYGNGVVTTYEYEPDTYRLSHLVTKNVTGKRLQDLRYSYDPVGNITEIRDTAQPTVYYGNSEVQPYFKYKYDSLYRLIEVNGREHATQANIPSPGNGWEALQTSDDLALQEYIQTYEYDAVGNISKMAHRRPNNNNTGWTRHYQYEQNNNRLMATTLGDSHQPFTDQYSYNAHGSITSMPHLPVIDWDFSEQLRHVDLQGGGDAYYVYDADGQRVRKVIETTGATIKDRIYLGGWEIYREHNNSGLRLERETLHIMDDQNRIALVETKTVGSTDAEGFEPIIRYQLGNHLGSVALELDGVGEIISYEEFHPYGTTAYYAGNSLVQVSQKRYRYTGKERDEETDFSYHGARYLSCCLGRWVNTDPIGIEGGINLYEYAFSNPIILTDKSGTNPLSLDPVIDTYEKFVEKEYAALEIRVNKDAFASKNPIVLSQRDLRILSEYMYFKGVSDYDAGKSYVDAMEVADTFLYDLHLVSREFMVGGNIYAGGEVNYIGVGAYNIAYGVPITLASPLIAVETPAWNFLQFLETGQKHEIPQTLFGMQWAQYGTFAAENLDARIDFIHAIEINAVSDLLLPGKKPAELQASLVMDVSSILSSEVTIASISDVQWKSYWTLRPVATFAGDMASRVWQVPQVKSVSQRTRAEIRSLFGI